MLRQRVRALRNKIRTAKQAFEVKWSKPDPKAIGHYYDKTTDQYLAAYGPIFQAVRPIDADGYIGYLAECMGIRSGMKLLDAGCGVCGVAVPLAQKTGAMIHGVTVSNAQVDHARKYITAHHLDEQVQVQAGNFESLAQLFAPDTFDAVYFMESLGYARDLKAVLKSAVAVLRPGGFIFIKDFYKKPLLKPEQKKNQQEIVYLTLKEYLYTIYDVCEVLSAAGKAGLSIEQINTPGYHADFEGGCLFEFQNPEHTAYLRAGTLPYLVAEILEIKLKKRID